MAESLQKYGADLLKGINVQRWNLSTDLLLDGDLFNVLSGITEGLGPRYGMAPIPGQSDTEAVAGTQNPGIMKAEAGFGAPIAASTNLRKTLFGVYPMRIGGVNANINTTGTFYAVVYGELVSGVNSKNTLGVTFLGIKAAGPEYQHTQNIYDGVCGGMLDDATPTQDMTLSIELVAAAGIANKKDRLSELTTVDATFFVSIAPFAVSGPSVPMQWIYGQKVAAASAVAAPTLNLVDATPAGGNLGTIMTGIPPEYNYGNFKKAPRTVLVYGLVQGDGGGNDNTGADYTCIYTPATTIYEPAYVEVASENLNPNANGAAVTRNGAPVYANVNGALVNDADCVCASSHKGFLIAAKQAIMVIIQDWARSPLGNLPQYVDLVNLPLEPRSIVNPTVLVYKEDGAVVPNCFNVWPSFTRGVAMGTTAATLGGANTGLLRANTVYEFTYSIYDKRLNFETNVGKGVKVQIGANDFNSIKLFDSGAIPPHTQAAAVAGGSNLVMPWLGTAAAAGASQADINAHINYLEYRFYYREEGSVEWRPALFIDVPKFWFFPYLKLYACTGGVGGNLGGQLNGFNDYSRLPQGNYTCAVVYKNRAFWFTESTMFFSPQNNFFAYPGRNQVACPSGTFGGAMVHAYYGQAEQDARIVVFTSRGTFVGKFTGNLREVPIQVSSNSVANFGLDGSDFVLNPWTSVTAFSYRSAVVAEGILYFWGPQGIFMDNGVETPVRISKELEPDIFTYYDPSKTDQICTLYNDTTKEILWFYAPKTADGYVTHALVFNTIRRKFDHLKFPGQVDAAQTLKIDTAVGTAGTRGLVFTRQDASGTIQRAQFFDQQNRAGDFLPASELMVKQLSTPSAGVRRLTMAAGSASLATVAVNDLICLQQLADYASGMTKPIDLIGKVKAVNAGAGTVDFFLPAAATALDAAYAPAHANYFPAYHLAAAGVGLNGIAWKMPTKYWMPAGVNMSMMWMHLYLLFQIKLLAADVKTTIGLKYRTPVSSVPTTDGYLADSFQLSDNSDGNFQLYRNLQLVNRSVEGQAMRWILSGNHIGHAWVLQWLEAHGNQQIFDFLKEFEG